MPRHEVGTVSESAAYAPLVCVARTKWWSSLTSVPHGPGRAADTVKVRAQPQLPWCARELPDDA